MHMKSSDMHTHTHIAHTNIQIVYHNKRIYNWDGFLYHVMCILHVLWLAVGANVKKKKMSACWRGSGLLVSKKEEQKKTPLNCLYSRFTKITNGWLKRALRNRRAIFYMKTRWILFFFSFYFVFLFINFLHVDEWQRIKSSGG